MVDVALFSNMLDCEVSYINFGAVRRFLVPWGLTDMGKLSTSYFKVENSSSYYFGNPLGGTVSTVGGAEGYNFDDLI